LKGVAIGNGWISPLEQTRVYGAQAYYGGLIDGAAWRSAEKSITLCADLVASAQWAQAQVECDGLLDNIVEQAGGINVDDVREWGSDEVDDRLEEYFSSPEVHLALGLQHPPKTYSSCSDEAGEALAKDEMMPSVQLLPRLIASLDQVMIYEGIFDLNCGVAGAENWLTNMLPSGQFDAAPRYLWLDPADSEVVRGYVKPLSASLTFVVVQGAGHMVPKTQPQAALDMLGHLLSGTPFPPHKPTTDAAIIPAAARNNRAGSRWARAMHRRRPAVAASSSSSSSSSSSTPRVVLRED
jgi:carboxypeptidase C (cathepsin A)